MKFGNFVTAAAFAASMCMGASLAQANVYDLASQFGSTNPSGVWAYGYFAPNSSTPTLFTAYTAASGNSPESWMDPSLSQTAVYGTPSVAHNPTSNEQSCCNSVVWLANEATFHPGQNDEVTFFRFTAPTTGTYQLTSDFSGRDYAGPTDTQVQIVAGNSVLYTGVVDGYNGDSSRAAFGPSPDISFDAPLGLVAGEDVYFEVSFDPNGTRGSGPFYFDTTGIAATLTNNVPEPVTLSLFGAGLVGAAALRRRKKKLA